MHGPMAVALYSGMFFGLFLEAGLSNWILAFCLFAFVAAGIWAEAKLANGGVSNE